MKAVNHPAYAVEKRRVERICMAMDRFIGNATSQQTLDQIYRSDDTAKSFLAAKRRERGRVLAEQDAMNNPVRGRFDLRAGAGAATEVFYLGLADLDKDTQEGFQVIDWRAPISRLFYQGECGNARYTGPDGLKLRCTLLLRRGLRVENRRLVDISDLDVLKGYTPDGAAVPGSYIADEFLTAILNSPAGGALREIISTIQREQHQIIKEHRNQALVLQAVAGSGKSTIALHRLAQILYDVRQVTKTPGQVVVFGPNKILVHYVSQLLPSLLESGIDHMTFADWAAETLFGEAAPGRPGPRVSRTAHPDPDQEAAIRTKGSMSFARALDRHLERLSQQRLPQRDIPVGPRITCPRSAVLAWYDEAKPMPYAERWRFVSDRLVAWAREQAGKLLPEIEGAGTGLLETVDGCYPPGERRSRLHEEFKTVPARLRNEFMQAVTDYVHQQTAAWQAWEVQRIYLDLITDPTSLAAVLDFAPADLQRFVAANKGVGARAGWDEADLGPLMYLHARIVGVRPEQRFTHAIVDEGQDWSPMQYAALSAWVTDHSVTIVGDLAQGLAGPYGLGRWEELRGAVFPAAAFQIRKVNRSYRLTRQTMALAASVLRAAGLGGNLPFEAIRDGEPPSVPRLPEARQAMAAVAQYAGTRCKDGRSVAVITPTEERAQQWLIWLNARGLPADLATETTEFAGRVTILPVALAKGLEFDYVAVVDADPAHYPNTPDSARALYVAITRAKQHVLVAAAGELSPLLAGSGGKER